MEDHFLLSAQQHWCLTAGSQLDFVLAALLCYLQLSAPSGFQRMSEQMTWWRSKWEWQGKVKARGGDSGHLGWTLWRWRSGGVWERFQGIFNLSDSCRRLLLYCCVPTLPPSLLFPTGEKAEQVRRTSSSSSSPPLLFPRSPRSTVHCGMWIFAALLPSSSHVPLIIPVYLHVNPVETLLHQVIRVFTPSSFSGEMTDS